MAAQGDRFRIIDPRLLQHVWRIFLILSRSQQCQRCKVRSCLLFSHGRDLTSTGVHRFLGREVSFNHLANTHAARLELCTERSLPVKGAANENDEAQSDECPVLSCLVLSSPPRLKRGPTDDYYYNYYDDYGDHTTIDGTIFK